MKIRALRQAVGNGWTINHRKDFVRQYGKTSTDELLRLSSLDDLGIDIFEYSQITPSLKTSSINDLITILKKRLNIIEHHSPIKEIRTGKSYCKRYLEQEELFDFFEQLPQDYTIPNSQNDISIFRKIKNHFYIEELKSQKTGTEQSKLKQ